MAREASGHGLHDAATAFLEAATKKAEQEAKNKTNLVIYFLILIKCFIISKQTNSITFQIGNAQTSFQK